MATKVPPPPAVAAGSSYQFYHAGDEETLALQGVPLTVQSHEFVAVIEPSGSAKSAPLACLATIDNPDGAHTSTERTESVYLAYGETYTFKRNW
jgi:ABC-type lipoprotein export system ATPase subunit